MPLERIFIHRLIRGLRLVIPLLVLVLIAIPAWNYLARRAQRSGLRPPSHQLPGDLELRTEGFTLSRSEGGRTLFTIHAKRNLGYKDSRNMLEDVEVIVYGATADEATRRIRSKYCSYDQETQDIRFEGAVEVELDERTTARSEEFTYSHRDRMVASPQKVFVEQAGSMNGEANSLEYGLDSGLLNLMGAVEVRTAQQTTLQTGSALFHQKENWTTMAGGVFIKAPTGWIRGTTGRADLEPGTYTAKTITIDGGVTAESQSQGGRDLWGLRADWIEAAISATGNVERVKTRGNVEVKKNTAGTHEVLTAAEADAVLNASGAVDKLHAQQNAQLVFASDRTLKSREIWVDAAQSIETGEESVLQMGLSTIEGRLFTIEQGEIATFKTAHRATLRSGMQQSSADQTRASFDSRTNMFRELVQTGNFKFKDSKYEGSSQSARFEDSGAVVTLAGSPVVTDAEKRLEAAEIRLNQKDNSFVATKNVRTFFKNSTAPVVVKSARACRGASAACEVEGADSLLYTGDVELWRGDTYIKAGRLDASILGNSNRLRAEGKVQSNFNNIRASADKLEYDDGRGVAHYTGNVRAQKQGMILETPDLTVTVREKDKTVADITASGGVVVTRGGQRGTGEKGVYESATDSVTLTGTPAQVQDKERTFEGARLIMKTSGETAVVEGGKGGRTVTRYPVKK